MIDQWAKDGPPIHISAAAYLGFTNKVPKKKVAANDKAPAPSSVGGNLNELAAMFNGSGGNF